MGGSYYSFPFLIISIEKDRKTPQRYPDVPTTSRRISIRSMDSFQELTTKIPTSNNYKESWSPSRQEESEHIVMNFILDQEERVEQLEEYIKVIIGDFMQLSSEVTGRLKDRIREEGGRLTKIEKITKYPDKEVPEPLARQKFPETPAKKRSTIPSNLSP
ncbi:hypothetical protein Tco_0390115 [Tanacetum coccineum]